MRARPFGKLGWPVTGIGFGAWAIGGSWGDQRDEDSLAALNRALDLGLTFIDTAAGYGDGRSERLIGRALQARGLRGGRNGRVRVATKIPPNHPGSWPPVAGERAAQRYPEAYLREQVETRLRNLNAETLDVLQLHTWSRTFNRDPEPLRVLARLKQEGKLLAFGISTPEHDQNAMNELVRAGLLDSVQVIYNVFEQDPEEELLPLCAEHGVAVIVRVVYDEGSLTGKFTKDTVFAEGDFRRNYFSGDRLGRTVDRVERLREGVAKASGGAEPDLAAVAVRFALHHPAVSTVITGIRTVRQAELNCSYGDLPPLSDAVHAELKRHAWRRSIWYGG